MDHKQIQRKLILFLDDELSGTEMGKIKLHLAECSSCSKKLEKIAQAWKFENEVRRLEPTPYLWSRLVQRIEEYETHEHFFTDFIERLFLLARPAFALVMLSLAILLGVYLGNAPLSNNAYNLDVQTSIQEREKFFSSIYLDSFRDLPPESIGGVYVAITALIEKGGDE